ncbi:regulatory protein [Patulibacter medicamentivorans]|uniref:Regulatory protein n=1 Tax=Patulibacter medicamentivorans TaxID=1097667 RepID=H0E071_9ACTN|nr:helix-turn-helix domain-containing protein [Patulibacter medicamentivorans]EHN12874.1 regulatory protein [Patulibacter medicamentivorans]
MPGPELDPAYRTAVAGALREIQSTEHDRAALLDVVARHAAGLTGADLGLVALRAPSGTEEVIAAFPVDGGMEGVDPDGALDAAGLARIRRVAVGGEGGPVGSVCVAWRSHAAPRPHEAWVLEALAKHAAIALEHGELRDTVRVRVEMLTRYFTAFREMTAATVEDLGVVGLVGLVERFLERTVRIAPSADIAPYLPAVVCRDADPGPADAGTWPIETDTKYLGQLVASGARLGALEEGILRYGARLIAIEAHRLRSAREAQFRLRAELLSEVLAGRPIESEPIRHLAARLDVRLDVPYAALAVWVDDPRRRLDALSAVRELETSGGSMLAVERERSLVIAVPDGAEVEEIAARLLAVLARQEWRPSIGVGRTTADLAAAAREAIAAARLAAAADGGLLHAAELGPLAFLLDAPDLASASESVLRILGPLEAHDARARVPLTPTLRAMIEGDGHHPTVAKRCGIHASTLKYRLGRIEHLLGVRLADRRVRIELALAIRLRTLLEDLGRRPLVG